MLDPDLFAASAFLDARAGDQGRPRGDHLLSASFRCTRCGASYSGTSGTGKSGQVHR